MTFAAASIGSLGQFGWAAANPVTAAYEYLDFDVQKHQEYIFPDGIRGTLDEQSETYVKTISRVAGTLRLAPTNTLLSTILLKAIQGGTPTGSAPTTYPVANANFDSYMTIDRVAKVDTYGLVWIDSATFSSSTGRELECSLDILGQSETTGNSGTFPTGLVCPYEAPFVHNEDSNAFTINGALRQIESISIVARNHYTRDRFFNSTTLQTPAKQKRTYEIRVGVPNNADNVDLLDLDPATDASGIFAWTDGTNTLTFTFGTLQLAETPAKAVRGKTENMLEIALVGRRITTTDALSITL